MRRFSRQSGAGLEEPGGHSLGCLGRQAGFEWVAETRETGKGPEPGRRWARDPPGTHSNPSNGKSDEPGLVLYGLIMSGCDLLVHAAPDRDQLNYTLPLCPKGVCLGGEAQHGRGRTALFAQRQNERKKLCHSLSDRWRAKA